MPEEQESEELDLLSDTQEPTMETGSLEFSDDVTSPRGTSTTLAATGASTQKRITIWHFSNIPSIAKVRRSWLYQEMVKIVKLAVPIFLMYFFQQLLFFLSLLLVGHSTSHSKTKLDAAALANSVVNVTGLSVVVGLTSAADTLCPQAFGFKNYRKVGIILQRGVLIVSLVCLPIAALWLNTESILLLLHQPPCVARLTGQFVQIFVLALLPMVVYVMIQKYLQAQSLVWVFVVVGILQNIINVLLAALLIYIADIVIIGSAISLVVSYVAVPFVIIGYVWGRGLHKQTWKGWSWDSLTEWGLFFKLGIPGLLMICFEWWTFEISTIVAGSVDELQLAVNTVLMQFGMINFAIPLGLGTAASVRVGNELGAGNPQKAKRATIAALVVQGIVASVMLVFFAGSRTVIAGVFTSEQDVIQETAKAMIPGTAVFFLDQFQGTFSGIIRGSGRQKIGAIMNFVFYYLIGLPIGISLVLLTDLGTTGMWTGLCIAVFLTDSTYVIIMLTTDWRKISELAMKNATDHKEDLLSTEKVDEASDTNSESSVVSMETATIELDAESAAATLLNPQEEEEHTSNGDINFEEEEIPLISFEDAELLDSTNKPHPPARLEHSKLFRKRLKLFLSKALFYALGVMVFVVGCVLLVSFQHNDVTEMCTLDEGHVNYSNSSSSSFSITSSVLDLSTLPSPTSTMTSQFEMLTTFNHLVTVIQ